mmetsp:Transcript_66478/g.97276  ORF Transcript_66478/g.97276 Transcript_66478/m.97276 type:complete len:309 (-) Transcript_66478:30-956(-)
MRSKRHTRTPHELVAHFDIIGRFVVPPMDRCLVTSDEMFDAVANHHMVPLSSPTIPLIHLLHFVVQLVSITLYPPPTWHAADGRFFFVFPLHVRATLCVEWADCEGRARCWICPWLWRFALTVTHRSLVIVHHSAHRWRDAHARTHRIAAAKASFNTACCVISLLHLGSKWSAPLDVGAISDGAHSCGTQGNACVTMDEGGFDVMLQRNIVLVLRVHYFVHRGLARVQKARVGAGCLRPFCTQRRHRCELVLTVSLRKECRHSKHTCADDGTVLDFSQHHFRWLQSIAHTHRHLSSSLIISSNTACLP